MNNSHRPTTLALVLKNCPKALDHYDSGVPIDRQVPYRFDVGTVAHEVLYALGMRRDVDDLCRRLVVEGRSGDDAEGPIHPDDVAEGRAVAEGWVERDRPTLEGAEVIMTPPIPAPEDDAAYEHPFSFDRDWNPVPWEEAYRRTRIDLRLRQDEGDEDVEAVVVTVRDYKSNWHATEENGELRTLQRKFQAVCAREETPNAAAIRVEVANLRTRKIYARTIWMDEEGNALLDRWKKEIEAAEAVADGPRTARPGGRCLQCRYVPRCEAAQAFLRSVVPGADGVSPDDVLRAWVVAKEQAKALEALAKSMTKGGVATVDGVSVGPVATRSVSPRPGFALDAMSTFLGRIGVEVDESLRNALASWVNETGEPGITLAKKMAKAALGHRAPKTDLADWIEARTMETPGNRFKTTRTTPKCVE